MSYANGTPFLNLAQTVGTDHRDWFDENEAKLDLDTKMKTLWDERTSTATILAALQESVAALDTNVTTLSGIVSGHTTTIATINESLVLINTALNALNTQVTNKFDSVGIADPYDATYGVYSVGDVVTYNGQRYVCNTAVTAAEPFDVSKWTAEDVQTVIDQIINEIPNLSHIGEWTELASFTATSTSITLSDSLDNYRAIAVTIQASKILSVSQISIGLFKTIPLRVMYQTEYVDSEYIDTTHISATVYTLASGQIAKVYGIK